LPNGLSVSEEVLKFIAELDPKIHISLMAQYYPTNRASKNILLNRKITETEYVRVLELLEKYGLENGWVQEMDSHEFYRPNFDDDREDPFGNNKIRELTSDNIS
jgi:putative pyruvate formate lyase activating enzyme